MKGNIRDKTAVKKLEKCYVNNAHEIELDEFKSDITNQSCCGVWLSQTSGMANISGLEKR